MSETESEKGAKKKKYSAARYIGAPNISKIQAGLLAVLKRETARLLDESHSARLSPESSRNLIQYLKLIRELDKPEAPQPKTAPDPDMDPPPQEDAFDDLSTEQLRQLAKEKQNV